MEASLSRFEVSRLGLDAEQARLFRESHSLPQQAGKQGGEVF
jgi:hypothetical protein